MFIIYLNTQNDLLKHYSYVILKCYVQLIYVQKMSYKCKNCPINFYCHIWWVEKLYECFMQVLDYRPLKTRSARWYKNDGSRRWIFFSIYTVPWIWIRIIPINFLRRIFLSLSQKNFKQILVSKFRGQHNNLK